MFFMEVPPERLVVKTAPAGVSGNVEEQESLNGRFHPEIQNPDIDFQKDSFEIEQPTVKEIQSQKPLNVDYSRPFSSELSLEIQHHLEKAFQEVILNPSREKEREGVLEAEKKIRYKILKQEQPQGQFKDGIPIVKPKRVIVRRKRFINPARRIPKYLPKIDGGMWKVWGYPEMIELSTSSSEEVVEIPEGVDLDQDGYPLLDPDKFDFTTLSPKWLRFLGKVTLYLLQSVSGFFMVKYAVKLWRSFTRDANRKHIIQPHNLSESSEPSSSDNDFREDY